MLAGALVALVVIAGPGDEKKLSDAARRLRVAWASQYEWREDGLKNVTLQFAWERTHVNGADEETVSNGNGQAVVVGNRVVRIHIDGGRDWDHREVADGVSWTLARYVRKPFEEEFSGIEIKDEGKSLSGAFKVSADGKTYYIKNDRLIAELREVGTPKQPQEVRVDFKLDDMGDGYARIREFFSRKNKNGKKLSTISELKPRPDVDTPVPQGYRLMYDSTGGKTDLVIEFEKPKVDVDNPVVMAKAASKILRDAWNNRYVLPQEIRVQAEFTRKPGKSLLVSGWTVLEGELQVWGMNQIEVELAQSNNRRRPGRNWRAARLETCQRHIRAAFGLMRPTPFEDEFLDCGFELAQDGPKRVINVYGYAAILRLRQLREERNALEKAKKSTETIDKTIAILSGRTMIVSVLVEDGFITGYRRTATGGDDWTYFKLKKNRAGKGVIQRILTTAEGMKLQAKWRYHRTKGVQVPKTIEMPVTPTPGRPYIGVCAYHLSRFRVTVPKD